MAQRFYIVPMEWLLVGFIAKMVMLLITIEAFQQWPLARTLPERGYVILMATPGVLLMVWGVVKLMRRLTVWRRR